MAPIQPLHHFPERVSATGGIVGEGIRNQLGRPRLDRLDLLAREAVQNSWDARLPKGAGLVRFAVTGWTLTDQQRRVLRETVFAGAAADLPLSKVRSVLALQDTGTWGLSGPTRADSAWQEPPPGHFVRFVWGVGQTSDAVRSGGTYGFGKAAYYLASRLHALVLHSHCCSGKGTEPRLLASMIHTHFQHQGRRYTGRHWWGRKSPDGLAAPVIGGAADQLAAALGMPKFPSGATGTTILILEPDIDGHMSEACVTTIRDRIFESFWPKLIDGRNGGPSMDFSFSWNGREVPALRMDHSPTTQAFADAFRRAMASTTAETPLARRAQIKCGSPRKDLGWLGLVRFAAPAVAPATADEEENSEGGPPLHGACHHIALMRSPHFVVRYIPCDQVSAMAWAGVFVADTATDGAFAQAEPPAHDEWNYQLLSDPHGKRFVRVALRRIREAAKEFNAPAAVVSADGRAHPLGELSDLLGGLIPSAEGEGARTPRAGSGGGGSGGGGGGARRPKRPRLEVVGTQLDVVRNTPALVTEFRVEGARGRSVIVVADVGVLLEDGTLESDPPAGASLPRVLRWSAGGRATGGLERFTVAEDGLYSVTVSLPKDAEVSVSLRAEWEAPC